MTLTFSILTFWLSSILVVFHFVCLLFWSSYILVVATPKPSQSSKPSLVWLDCQVKATTAATTTTVLFEPGTLKSDTLKTSAVKGPSLDQLWTNFGPTLDQSLGPWTKPLKLHSKSKPGS